MSEGTSNVVGTPGGVEMLVARQASRDSLAFGAVLIVLGIFAVLAPMFAGIAVTVLVGMLLIFAGIFELVFAFQSDSLGKGVLKFLFGGLSVLAGVIIILTPMDSLGVLTLVLAGFLLAGGVFDIVFAVRRRSEGGGGWVLFSGIMSILLGVLIIVGWPISGIWVVGLYAGIRMLTHGWLLMALGRTGKESLTLLQDTRIERLEHHVRSGALVLQKTQAALAEQTTMMVALDSELRKKVALSDVDPAMQGLNESLAKARERMESAAAATKEAWDSVQQEAAEEFERLEQRTSELTTKLKKELGI